MRIKVLILVGLVLLIFSSFSVSYALYNNYASGDVSDVSVAKFIFNGKMMDSIDALLNNFSPGEKREYNFSVSNSTYNLKSDISIGYFFSVDSMFNLPLKISLYDKNTSELILSCDKNSKSCKSDTFYLLYDDNNSHEYTLVIYMDSNVSFDYQDSCDYLVLNLDSFQKVS